MKHLFVSYEIALTLKEKGFDEPCLANYWVFGKDKNNLTMTISGRGNLSDLEEEFGWAYHHLDIPLYQQVVDWLREKYSLHIYLYTMGFGYVGSHNNIPDPATWGDDKRWEGKPKDKYYEALTEAITHALTLIP